MNFHFRFSRRYPFDFPSQLNVLAIYKPPPLHPARKDRARTFYSSRNPSIPPPQGDDARGRQKSSAFEGFIISSGRRCSSHQYGCHFLVSFLSLSRAAHLRLSPPLASLARLSVCPRSMFPPFAGKCLRTPVLPVPLAIPRKTREISIRSRARYSRHTVHIMAQTAESGEKRTVLAAKFLPAKSVISICSFIKFFFSHSIGAFVTKDLLYI